MSTAMNKKDKEFMKKYGLSIPRCETKGERRGKVWPELDADPKKWRIIYQEMDNGQHSTADKLKIAKFYSASMQTISRKAGVPMSAPTPTAKERKERINEFSKAVTQEYVLHQLKQELKAKEDEVKALKVKIKKIEALDEDMFDTISELTRM